MVWFRADGASKVVPRAEVPHAMPVVLAIFPTPEKANPGDVIAVRVDVVNHGPDGWAGVICFAQKYPVWSSGHASQYSFIYNEDQDSYFFEFTMPDLDQIEIVAHPYYWTDGVPDYAPGEAPPVGGRP